MVSNEENKAHRMTKNFGRPLEALKRAGRLAIRDKIPKTVQIKLAAAAAAKVTTAATANVCQPKLQ